MELGGGVLYHNLLAYFLEKGVEHKVTFVFQK